MNDQAPSVSNKTNDNLSLTSMILGILSLIMCSIFAGIPAVITGHIALGKTKKDPQTYGGHGLAVAGLIMGYISIAMLVLVVPILAAMLLPALAKAKYRAQQVSCVNNMKQIGLAARMYANDHGDKFPPSFLAMSNELNTPKILTCPSDKRTRAETWSGFNTANVSYVFLTPDLDESKTPQPVPAFRCTIHNNVGLSDGSVQQGRPQKGGAGMSGD
jgi:type II secretory pathway pseudopilin PulG